MSSLKPILAFIVVGYLVSVYVFAYDPFALILKDDEKNVARAAAPRSGPLRSRKETIAEARRFMKEGMSLADIEDRFDTQAVRIGQVYKSSLFLGEANYDQYRIALGHGVVAYVLAETYARQIAGNPGFLKFDSPHTEGSQAETAH